MGWTRYWSGGVARWSRTRRWATVGLALVALVVAARAAGGGAQSVAQPIAFNHRTHTQQLQLDCEFCHPYVKVGAHPGLPTLETCAPCHQSVQGKSREAARVTEYVLAGRALRFAKLFRLPPHVFYTHRSEEHTSELQSQR